MTENGKETIELLAVTHFLGLVIDTNTVLEVARQKKIRPTAKGANK